jgi:hypothetical protein
MKDEGNPAKRGQMTVFQQPILVMHEIFLRMVMTWTSLEGFGSAFGFLTPRSMIGEGGGGLEKEEVDHCH